MEASLVFTERLDAYSNVEPEASWTSDNSPPPDWPAEGSIEFLNYSTRCCPGLDFTLRDMNLKLNLNRKLASLLGQAPKNLR
ncbi:multidrug resistance protein-like [Tropilaelaps mercedesae]|uniref:Multidrug resistance protein-like n=1 Tax=Tropilaelaps mercedesae TaxID=418985 RepID=A0A1V9X7G5_9ACAR|nr:multidrug resistance protein-like [Tropilaelaps mercedesae]